MCKAKQKGSDYTVQPFPERTRKSTLVEPFYTVKEAAKELDITTGAVYLAMKHGRLKWHYLGSQKVINASDVNMFPRSVQAETKRRLKRERSQAN